MFRQQQLQGFVKKSGEIVGQQLEASEFGPNILQFYNNVQTCADGLGANTN